MVYVNIVDVDHPPLHLICRVLENRVYAHLKPNKMFGYPSHCLHCNTESSTHTSVKMFLLYIFNLIFVLL